MNTNREPTYAKDGKHINIRDLKDLSRQILALVNEYDRQRSTLAWTEQEMTSLLQKCHKQELELKSLQLENFQLKKMIKELMAQEVASDVYIPHELPAAITDDIMRQLSMSLEDSLNLDNRTKNTLHQVGIYTMEDLLRVTKEVGLRGLLRYRGFGPACLSILNRELQRKGILNPDGSSGLYKYVIA